MKQAHPFQHQRCPSVAYALTLSRDAIASALDKANAPAGGQPTLLLKNLDLGLHTQNT